MKKVLSALILTLAIGSAWGFDLSTLAPGDVPHGTVQMDGSVVTVCFSPNGCVEELIVNAINRAQKQVLVQAYAFTNRNILWALAKAKARGLDVEVIVDHSEEAQKGRDYLASQHVPIWVDYQVAIAHNKVMILDGKDLINGSANFTEASNTRNAENTMYIQNCPSLAQLFIQDWNWRKGQSRAFSQ